MKRVDDSDPRLPADFEREALVFLPNVARYARLLTRDQADADDLTQETFLRACHAWSSYRANTDCRKWLFAICRNTYLRNRQRSNRFVSEHDAEVESYGARDLYGQAVTDGLEDLFDRVDIGPALRRSIDALPPEYREAVILVDVEDYSYEDAARLVRVPMGTIRSRLFRARRRLQQSLLEHARDLGFSPGPGASSAQPL